MIELIIKSVEWQNFMSYGDYVSKINIEELGRIGPALILGQFDGDPRRSNGAGKSSIVEAIIWCLFDRTNFKSRPADRIINWYTGKDCYVEIELIDGTTIRRTRKTGGRHSDLLIHKADGEDISSGTNPEAQKKLLKDFNLDYNIFTSRIFFGQFGTPFLELSDPKRRKALERILHLSHLAIYADVAKKKHEAAEQEQDRIKTKIDSLEREMARINGQIERNRDMEANFETKRDDKIQKIKNEIVEIEERYDRKTAKTAEKIKAIEKEILAVVIPDIKALKKKWEAIEKINDVISEKKDAQRNRESDIRVLESDQNRLKNEIKEWESQAGKKCPKCKQEIQSSHVTEMANPKKKELEEILSKIDDLNKAKASTDEVIANALKKVKEATPNQTVEDAKEIIEDKKELENDLEEVKTELGEIDDDKKRDISNKNNDIEEVKKEQNPYGEIIKDLNGELSKIESNLKSIGSKIKQLDILLKHIHYVRSAYHDKKKIKAFILSNLIPFFNERIAYHLDASGLDFELEFDSYLQKKVNKWDYEFMSGGERKRIDLTVMFALYDLHEAIYGRQCNLLVFDEVDGRLDDPGIEFFINTLYSNYVKDDRSILIVSHKGGMVDAFPTKINVIKKGDFSHIEEVR